MVDREMCMIYNLFKKVFHAIATLPEFFLSFFLNQFANVEWNNQYPEIFMLHNVFVKLEFCPQSSIVPV